MYYVDVCNEIVDKMKEMSRENFSKNGIAMKNIDVQKIYMCDEYTLVELHFFKGRLIPKSPLGSLEKNISIRVIFYDIECFITPGNPFVD